MKVAVADREYTTCLGCGARLRLDRMKKHAAKCPKARQAESLTVPEKAARAAALAARAAALAARAAEDAKRRVELFDKQMAEWERLAPVRAENERRKAEKRKAENERRKADNEREEALARMASDPGFRKGATAVPTARPDPKFVIRFKALDSHCHAEILVFSHAGKKNRIADYGEGLVRKTADRLADQAGFSTWTPSEVEPYVWYLDAAIASEHLEFARSAVQDFVTIEVARSMLGAKQRKKAEPTMPGRNAGTLKLADLDIKSTRRAKNQNGRHIEWFELTGSIKFNDMQIQLADLVRAVRNGGRYVQIGPGDFVSIGPQLISRLAQIADQADDDGEMLRIGAAGAITLDFPPTVLTGPLAELRNHWKKSQTAVVELPDLLDSLGLREYQIAGVKWLIRLSMWAPGGCVADEMGLGKTRQAIAFLATRSIFGPALVVAPKSVAEKVWQDELAACCGALQLEPIRFAAWKARSLEDRVENNLVVVMGYNEAAGNAGELGAITWGTIVYDEAHYLKNPGTKRTAALESLKGKFVLTQTGTPVENRARDIWSLSRFFAPTFFGTQSQFCKRFEEPITGGDKKASGRLARFLEPFLLRRTKAEYLQDLPLLTDVVEEIELDTDEVRIYESIRKLREAESNRLLDGLPEARRGRGIELLKILGKLVRAAAHPPLADDTLPRESSKIKRLKEMLTENRAGGHQAIVFSQWLQVLDVLQAELTNDFRCVRYDGKDHNDQDAALLPFKQGDADVLLMSLGVGAVGLNIQSASYVYLFDPWWNPQREMQAIARAHRQGQTKPVTAVHLIAAGTVEQKIAELQQQKRDLFNDLMDGKSNAGGLTSEDVLDLMRAVQ